LTRTCLIRWCLTTPTSALVGESVSRDNRSFWLVVLRLTIVVLLCKSLAIWARQIMEQTSLLSRLVPTSKVGSQNTSPADSALAGSVLTDEALADILLQVLVDLVARVPLHLAFRHPQVTRLPLLHSDQPVLGSDQPHQASRPRVLRSLQRRQRILQLRRRTSPQRLRATRLLRQITRLQVQRTVVRQRRQVTLRLLQASVRLHPRRLRRRSTVPLRRCTVRQVRPMAAVVTSNRPRHRATHPRRRLTVLRVHLHQRVRATRPLVRCTTLRHGVPTHVRMHPRVLSTLRIAQFIPLPLPRKTIKIELDRYFCIINTAPAVNNVRSNEHSLHRRKVDPFS
jgi:hypothetical protein